MLRPAEASGLTPLDIQVRGELFDEMEAVFIQVDWLFRIDRDNTGRQLPR